jgi:hypothetical protein
MAYRTSTPYTSGRTRRTSPLPVPPITPTTSAASAPSSSTLSSTPLSPQQLAVCEWVSNGSGSATVDGVAGCGKTYTLRAAAERMTGSVAYCVFNKKNADEAVPKFRALPNVRVGTFHSFGFAAWRRYLGSSKVQVEATQKTRAMLEALEVPDKLSAAVSRMVSLAKQSVVGLLWDPADEAEWNRIIDHYDILLHVRENGMTEEQCRAMLAAYSSGCVTWAREMAKMLIDFDDMIWCPLVEMVPIYQNDWVMVDEYQDTNPGRRLLARRMLKAGGRALFVGDRNQAIYGFCHPPGTLIQTPTGGARIETLSPGDPVIISNTQGDTEGYDGSKKVIQAHTFHHSGLLIEIDADGRRVACTPHHRIPVRIGTSAYFTYLMRRQGVYRVGSCQAYTSGQFMLQLRKKTEKADAVWILAQYETKEEARRAEEHLLVRVKGCSFALMSDEEINRLPTDEVEALKILSEHGRMVDFPLLTGGSRSSVRIARNGAFVTEACNLLDGMEVAFFSAAQVVGGRKGKNRQRFQWTSIMLSYRPYSGPVYGITVPDSRSYRHGDYIQRGLPLYFAGDGILVHNTGADSDAVDQVKADFQCASLPLTVTYRCSKTAARYAQQWVPHIEPHEGNAQGSLDTLTFDQFWNGVEGRVGDGDAILCRNTKPLVELAFSLIRTGIGCHVEGRDIGKQLSNLASKWKVESCLALTKNLESYRLRETEKLVARKADYAIEALNDRIDTLFVIMDGCDTVPQLLAKIDSLFKDTDGTVRSTVTLSTVHKAKGREWDRVFILGMEKLMPSKYARKAWELVQEDNLCYVAVTRCKRDLILVSLPEETKR